LSFIVFLLALWSVDDDDLPLLPVTVAAGSFCAQTHVPYLGLTLGLGRFVAVWASWTAYGRRKNKAALRRFFTWAAAGVSSCSANSTSEWSSRTYWRTGSNRLAFQRSTRAFIDRRSYRPSAPGPSATR